MTPTDVRTVPPLLAMELGSRGHLVALAMAWHGVDEEDPILRSVVRAYPSHRQWPLADHLPAVGGKMPDWCAIWIGYLLRDGVRASVPWVGSTSQDVVPLAAKSPAAPGDRFGAVAHRPGHVGIVIAELAGGATLTIEGNVSDRVSVRRNAAGTWSGFWRWWG
jgi:hypothetical protein